MSNTTQRIKGHPGFMPMWSAGVKKSNEQTQSEREKKISSQESASDAQKSK